MESRASLRRHQNLLADCGQCPGCHVFLMMAVGHAVLRKVRAKDCCHEPKNEIPSNIPHCVAGVADGGR